MTHGYNFYEIIKDFKTFVTAQNLLTNSMQIFTKIRSVGVLYDGVKL